MNNEPSGPRQLTPVTGHIPAFASVAAITDSVSVLTVALLNWVYVSSASLFRVR